jgi:23S rRNA (cytosine1962-C5)-methyltransferase
MTTRTPGLQELRSLLKNNDRNLLVKTIRLRPGKERAALRGHPWIFDSAIAGGSADSGETVKVEGSDGKFLGWAAFSPASKIKLRIWSFKEEERIDEHFFQRQINNSVQARSYFDIQSEGVRIIHSEVDGLPGLIVDRYKDTLVVQFLSAGVERFKGVITKALATLDGIRSIYERSDVNVRALEGLEPRTGWLWRAGRSSRDTDSVPAPVLEAPTHLVIQEHEWLLGLDIEKGHKTGFYLDQRDSRKLFSEYAKRLGFKRVLNCYCYTGGFTVAALKGMQASGSLSEDAYVLSVDSSAPALDQAREQLVLNGLDTACAEFRDADVNQTLRALIDAGETFDAVVLDPPKFAPTVSHAERAARAYKDINRLAFKLLKPKGVLFTFSCSGGISADLFHKIVASAGADAGVDGYIMQRLGAAPDHPMSINFPEGEYLKGLVVLKK